jgi:hypothetical protein
VKFAPLRLQPLRSVLRRCAPLRFAPLRSAPLRSASLSIVPVPVSRSGPRLALVRFASFSAALWRLAALRSAPMRLALQRFAPFRPACISLPVSSVVSLRSASLRSARKSIAPVRFRHAVVQHDGQARHRLAAISHDEARGLFLDGPRRRKAARCDRRWRLFPGVRLARSRVIRGPGAERQPVADC